MATIGESLRDIMFAGIGAVAVTAEKGKEVIDSLVEKGELTVDEGKQLNQELKHKADSAAKNIRESAVEARMRIMTPEERQEFAARVAELAAEQNAADAAKATVEEVVDIEVEAEEAAEEVED